MKKNNLIDNLKKLYDEKKLFNSIILESKSSNFLEDIANELIRYIYCLNHSWINDNCENCIRSFKHEILDTSYLTSDNGSISKENVQMLIKKMSLSPVENKNVKVYVIRNIENLTNGAANSLLKFLEEPPLNTYAILLSKNRTIILQTIKSRSKTFIVDNDKINDELNNFEKIINTKNKTTYLLAANNFKKINKIELIEIIEQSYQRTILKKYVNLAEDTLNLIQDLKYSANPNLAIDYYFIKITEK